MTIALSCMSIVCMTRRAVHGASTLMECWRRVYRQRERFDSQLKRDATQGGIAAATARWVGGEYVRRLRR